jgi:hypothetical protein
MGLVDVLMVLTAAVVLWILAKTVVSTEMCLQ